MSRLFVIDAGPVETRAALIENDIVTALWAGPGADEKLPPQPGERAAVTIRTIDTSLGLAFADLPTGEEGVMPLPLRQTLSQGERLVVDIRRAARPGKLADLRVSPDQSEPDEIRPTAATAALSAIGGEGDAVSFLGQGPAFTALKATLPGRSVERADFSIFETSGIEAAFEEALSRQVSLADGVRLTIDETEALSAVDIDLSAVKGQSASGTRERASRLAVPEIARQLTLRAIGGQVVIDFPLARRQGRAVESALQGECALRGGWRVHRLTETGLAALTVPRARPSLLETLTEPGGDAPVPGRRFTARHLAARALRRAERALATSRSAGIVLHLPQEIAALVDAHPGWTRPLRDSYGERLTLKSHETRNREWCDVSDTD